MARNDIMQRLADANPLNRSVAEEWERSGAAEALLARVLASAREEAPPAPVRPGRRRWVWAAPVTALAGIAVLVAVLLRRWLRLGFVARSCGRDAGHPHRGRCPAARHRPPPWPPRADDGGTVGRSAAAAPRL